VFFFFVVAGGIADVSRHPVAFAHIRAFEPSAEVDKPHLRAEPSAKRRAAAGFGVATGALEVKRE
jgi:hypothetical protein